MTVGTSEGNKRISLSADVFCRAINRVWGKQTESTLIRGACVYHMCL